MDSNTRTIRISLNLNNQNDQAIYKVLEGYIQKRQLSQLIKHLLKLYIRSGDDCPVMNSDNYIMRIFRTDEQAKCNNISAVQKETLDTKTAISKHNAQKIETEHQGIVEKNLKAPNEPIKPIRTVEQIDSNKEIESSEDNEDINEQMLFLEGFI